MNVVIRLICPFVSYENTTNDDFYYSEPVRGSAHCRGFEFPVPLPAAFVSERKWKAYQGIK